LNYSELPASVLPQFVLENPNTSDGATVRTARVTSPRCRKSVATAAWADTAAARQSARGFPSHGAPVLCTLGAAVARRCAQDMHRGSRRRRQDQHPVQATPGRVRQYRPDHWLQRRGRQARQPRAQHVGSGRPERAAPNLAHLLHQLRRCHSRRRLCRCVELQLALRAVCYA
jgi:acyl-CoA synthetase (NDP forming)